MKYVIAVLMILLGSSLFSQSRLDFDSMELRRTVDLYCQANDKAELKVNDNSLSGIWADMKQDHKNFYSIDNGLNMLQLYAIGGVIANTNADDYAQDWFQDNRSSTTDDASEFFKTFGEGTLIVPVYGATMLLRHFTDNNCTSTLGEWGERSLRATLLGAPPMLLGQVVTGGGRPTDGDPSRWKPFDDNNGVSGHAFMGAVPFLTAAEMTDNTFLKAAYIFGSIGTAYSRVNDDDHYLSQAILGWGMAYLSVQAVNNPDRKWFLTAGIVEDQPGLRFLCVF